MKKYFFTQPPVFGQWGPKTKKDESGRVTKLHYLVDVIPTSEFSKSSPYLILTTGLQQDLARCTGILFHEGLFEPSDIYQEINPSLPLPKMLWAEITGTAHHDDFGLERGSHLIVSERAKALIEKRRHGGVTFTEGSAPSDDQIKCKIFDDAKSLMEQMKAKKKAGSGAGSG
jgi:hypothetical protein